MSDSSENFLSRWSRRKRQARDTHVDDEPSAAFRRASVGDGAGHSAEIAGRQAQAADHVADDALDQTVLSKADNTAVDSAHVSDVGDDGHYDGQGDGQGEHPQSSPLDDIDFDELDFNSDYQRFMSGDVSDDTRNKALRRLWVSNPLLANQDGLDDYCEDYTDAAVCLPKGVMKSAYKFGRGFLDDDEVAEWEALGRPETDIAEDACDDDQRGEGVDDAPSAVDQPAPDCQEAVDGPDRQIAGQVAGRSTGHNAGHDAGQVAGPDTAQDQLAGIAGAEAQPTPGTRSGNGAA